MCGKKLNSKITAQINQANPLELVIIAYDGAIGFLQEAKKSFKTKNYKEAKALILKAKKIIVELENALDMNVEEVSANLLSLYKAMNHLMDLALKKKDISILEQVLKMFLEIREAWKTISEQNSLKKHK